MREYTKFKEYEPKNHVNLTIKIKRNENSTSEG